MDKINLNILFLLFISIIDLGCSNDKTVIDSASTVIGNWDPSATTIISNNPGFADGTSQSIVRFQIFNTQGIPMASVQLNASTSSIDVTPTSCSVSDFSGVVTCYFTSNISGNTGIQIGVGEQKFDSDVTFISPPTKLYIKRASNSQLLKQSVSGYSVTTGVRKYSTFKNQSSGYIFNTISSSIKLNLTSP